MSSSLAATVSVVEFQPNHASGSSKQAWHIPDAVFTVRELLMMGKETARNIQSIDNNIEIVCKKPKEFIHSSIPLACAEFDDSLPFSGASSIPLCYIPFPFTLFHQLVLHAPSLHLSIYFLVFLSTSLFPNSYIIFLEILFSSILCTCPNKSNQFNLIVSVIVGFLTIAQISLLVNILQFSFSFSYTGPKILLYIFLSNMFICFQSLFVSTRFLKHMLNFYLLLCSLSQF